MALQILRPHEGEQWVLAKYVTGGPASSSGERVGSFRCWRMQGVEIPSERWQGWDYELKSSLRWGQGVTTVQCHLAPAFLACFSEPVSALQTRVQPPELSFQNLKSSKLLPDLGRDWALFLLLLPSLVHEEEVHEIDWVNKWHSLWTSYCLAEGNTTWGPWIKTRGLPMTLKTSPG